MPEYGYTDFNDIVAKLAEIETVSYRMTLENKEGQWDVYMLVIDVFFARIPSIQRDIPFYSYSYENVAFVAGTVAGRDASEWLIHGIGNINGFAFHFPAIQLDANKSMNWTKYPSHANTLFASVPFPYTQYTLINHSASQVSSMGFLVDHEAPFFSSFQSAVSQLMYGKSQSGLLGSGIIVRFAHIEARIATITISPLSLTVNIEGTDLLNTRLQVSGLPDLQFERNLHGRKIVECPLPEGMPSEVWIVLSRSKQWLDYAYISQQWSPFASRQENIKFTPPDLRTQIQDFIAQGEGSTIEFKQEVPNKNDQMLKTVAAFANGQGGVILIGIQDRTGDIVGIGTNTDIHEVKDRITNMIRNTVYPEPEIRVEHCSMDGQSSGRRVIALYVDKGMMHPYCLHQNKPEYYVRRGATTFMARPEEVRALVLANALKANNNHG